MGLKFKTVEKYRYQIIWGIVAAIVIGCLLRVAIWEHNYYNEKEGSERAVATQVGTQDVDETEVTEEQKAEYIVAPDQPRYLSIEKLNVNNARILPMGTTEDGAMDTPYNIFDVGWYTGSSAPGTGGTTVIDGHNGGPNIEGVFKHLPELSAGDKITIEMGDGTIYTYVVHDNYSTLIDNPEEGMKNAEISPVKGQESITLITCTGEWSQTRQTYLSRQFTRAVRME